MLSEVVRKHLLKDKKQPLTDDDLEIAIYAGWNARNDEIESLRQKLAIAEKALVQIKILRKDVNSLFHNIASEALVKIRGEG